MRELKIDRSFVTAWARTPGPAIVRTSSSSPHNLDLRVVAEGVEGRRGLALLASWAATSTQGWYVCRPQPADLLTPWLHARDRAFATG